MNLTLNTYSRLKTRLQKRYLKELQDIQKHLGLAPPSKIQTWMKKHESEFETYSPLRWFFVKQLETYLFFIGEQEYLSEESTDFSDDDDAVFEKWNQSEFADSFLKLLNRGASLSQANRKNSEAYDEHLVTLGERHFLKHNRVSPNYRLQGSLGEVGTSKKPMRLLETTLRFEGKELSLRTKTLKEMKAFSTRIEEALTLIKKFSPDSWERFKAFTETIIPIKQKELVSYSHQELPGASMINLYHRDFVDLMDDLLHENGHHHLNYYLNLGTLIEEPQDLIYYSPWRRTLRPLRGIYHAYFTFFWAFKLFADLARQLEDETTFTAQEKQKILSRAVEEYWMLDYSFVDLKIARKRGLIHESGWKLVDELNTELKKVKRLVPKWEARIKKKRELNELKKTLVNARKNYQLS